MRALVVVPAEVGAQPAGLALPWGRDVVDLLPGGPAYVGDSQCSGGRVEGDAPGVAQAEGEDFVLAGLADIRVVAGDVVAATLLGVDAQDLPQQADGVLGVVLGVLLRTSVPGAGVEVFVRPELELAAVVIAGLIMVDLDHPLAGAGSSSGRLAGPGSEPVHADVAAVVDVIDVEAPVVVVIGVERHREKPLLTSKLNLVADVEKRLLELVVVADHADTARLLDHEEEIWMHAVVVVDRRAKRGNLVELVGDGAGAGASAGQAHRQCREGGKHGSGCERPPCRRSLWCPDPALHCLNCTAVRLGSPGLSLGIEAVDGALERGGVDVSLPVFAEGAQGWHVDPQSPVVARLGPGFRGEAAKLALAVVAVEVAAVEGGEIAVTYDVAPGDGAAAVATVDGHRRHRVRRLLVLVEAVRSLERRPSEVRAGAVSDAVDLLERVLADVAYPQIARLAIKGEAPWVAQAVGVDRRHLAGHRDVALPERVALRYRVGEAGGRIWIDPQKLSQERAEILPVALRVAGRPSVAEADVELVVRTEQHEAAVVVGERLIHSEDLPGALRVGDGRV